MSEAGDYFLPFKKIMTKTDLAPSANWARAVDSWDFMRAEEQVEQSVSLSALIKCTNIENGLIQA